MVLSVYEMFVCASDDVHRDVHHHHHQLRGLHSTVPIREKHPASGSFAEGEMPCRSFYGSKVGTVVWSYPGFQEQPLRKYSNVPRLEWAPRAQFGGPFISMGLLTQCIRQKNVIGVNNNGPVH